MSNLKGQSALTLVDLIMSIAFMNEDKLSFTTKLRNQNSPQASAWMRAQFARLHNGYDNRAFSSWLAAIVASLVMFGLQ